MQCIGLIGLLFNDAESAAREAHGSQRSCMLSCWYRSRGDSR